MRIDMLPRTNGTKRQFWSFTTHFRKHYAENEHWRARLYSRLDTKPPGCSGRRLPNSELWSSGEAFYGLTNQDIGRLWTMLADASREDAIELAVQAGGGSVMYWVFPSGLLVEVSENLNKHSSIELLDNHVLPFALLLSDKWNISSTLS